MFRPAKNVEMTETMAKSIDLPYPKQKSHYISTGTNFHKNLLSLMGTFFYTITIIQVLVLFQIPLKGNNDPMYTGLIYLFLFDQKMSI